MSTRSVLAYIPKKGSSDWKGIYCHWDGYPTNRGRQIWKILHKDFLGNKGKLGVANTGDPHNAVEAFVKVYIEGHPAGWSSFPKECYCHSPEFVMRDGAKNEEFFTNKSVGDSWCEWVYVINPEKLEMKIYSLYGDIKVPKPVETVDLMGKEPNWEDIESRG